MGLGKYALGSFLIALSFYLFANMPSFIDNSGYGAFAYIGLFLFDIAVVWALIK